MSNSIYTQKKTEIKKMKEEKKRQIWKSVVQFNEQSCIW